MHKSLIIPNKDSKTWVKHLQNIVKNLNNQKTGMIDMKPKDAIKLKEVTLNLKYYPKEEVLPEDGLYRYLYEPGELRRRAKKTRYRYDLELEYF